MVAVRAIYSDVLRLQVTEREFYHSNVMDRELREHATRVGWYSYLLAKQYGYTDDHAQIVMRGAMYHDVGKSLVPDEIENKPSKLTAEEFDIVKRHCVDGVTIAKQAGIIQNDDSLESITFENIILSHHENYDGSGYPQALKGDEIPIEANLVSLADVFDALLSERVYKKAWEEDRVVDYINENSGKIFRPDVVECFNQIRHGLIAMKRHLTAEGTPTPDPHEHPAIIAKTIVRNNVYVPFILPRMEFNELE
ncbi:MAG: HD domain-containing protein [Neptunomonas phycophila]|uniref:HD-GYP domain-containing protein n=1 Tax=Neptunomonas phycophila TaxID=1572645 RepID=UPI003B8C6E84